MKKKKTVRGRSKPEQKANFSLLFHPILVCKQGPRSELGLLSPVQNGNIWVQAKNVFLVPIHTPFVGQCRVFLTARVRRHASFGCASRDLLRGSDSTWGTRITLFPCFPEEDQSLDKTSISLALLCSFGMQAGTSEAIQGALLLGLIVLVSIIYKTICKNITAPLGHLLAETGCLRG